MGAGAITITTADEVYSKASRNAFWVMNNEEGTNSRESYWKDFHILGEE